MQQDEALRVLPVLLRGGSLPAQVSARRQVGNIGNSCVDTLTTIRLTLSAAASMQANGRTLDREAQVAIEAAILHLDDEDTARRERDAALRAAFRECRYSVADLDLACQLFLAHKWPTWRHRAAPPADASRMHCALFAASRYALALSPDGWPELPRARRLRMIVQSTPSECTAPPASCADLLTKGSQ